MLLSFWVEAVGFGIYADISFSWLKASEEHATGAVNLANEPNAGELISMCWKRPANNCVMLASRGH